MGNYLTLFLFSTLNQLHILCFIFHSQLHFPKWFCFQKHENKMGKMHTYQ